ncbi:PDDEXK nuclease domain-containing protein [Pedobacter sp. AW31-3R]|uniref:PDDEXK nuclease domain-containing protein n=1 Tax=Pedobacter sp. AW31-3R TaxID=3445781 RepID=UPI003F9F06E5
MNLSEPFSESELKKGLIKQMKTFILELGRDFIFIGEEYKIMVGNSDFYLDLLFYHV